MRWKLFLVFVFALFAVGAASAEFYVNNSYIQKNYDVGQSVKGWTNVRFENQELNVSLRDSFGNTINLSSLLNLNPGYNYTLNATTATINSSYQKLYFDNASFNLPNSPTNIKYVINFTNRTFASENITISNTKNLLDASIDDKKEDLKNVILQISNYNLFLKNIINSELMISDTEKNLSNIEKSFNSTTSQSQYEALLAELNKMKIPVAVAESETANSISLIQNEDNIDLEFLKTIGGGNYNSGNEEADKTKIIFWDEINLEPKLTFKKINANYGNTEENILSYFEISINQKPAQSVFLVLGDMKDLEFDKDYGEEEKDGYTYIDFSKADKKVVFATTEELNFADAPIFISPSLSVALAGENIDVIDSDEESRVSKWVLFSLIIILLVIIFAVVYFFLHRWYEKKYENHLFSNRNNLYNLVVYINGAKKKGVSDSEIEKNLRKAKWSGEQIRYVMRKYAGKRTGLWSPSGNKEKIEKTSHKI